MDTSPQLDLPLARRTDPATSHAAAARVDEFAPNHHGRIMAALREMPTGGTVYELETATGIAAHAIGKRMHELQAAGAVRETGETRGSPSGRSCRVWCVSPPAFRVCVVQPTQEK